MANAQMAMDVGRRLVSLCREGRFQEAIGDLYADDIVSVEAMGGESMPRVLEGLEAVRRKSEWWSENHEIHAVDVEGPFPNEDRFAVVFRIEATSKVGPRANERVAMEEIGVYTVADGKVTREEFFYGAES